MALLVKCFGGCDARDVLAELRRRGLVDADSPQRRVSAPRFAPPPSQHDPDPAALELWRKAKPAGGTVVEMYLRNRGVTIPIPPSIRCGETLHLGRFHMPTLVAAVQRPDGKIVAVQQTLLTWGGSKAPAGITRITTGALGDGAVRLARADDYLGIAEGVETALSAMQLGGVPCWACLGAGRMHRVLVPDHVHELHVFADADEVGRAAAERAAQEHRHRRVVLRFPPDGFKDWNDYLRSLPHDNRREAA